LEQDIWYQEFVGFSATSSCGMFEDLTRILNTKNISHLRQECQNSKFGVF
jgi:hypothetical protein